MVIWWTFTFNCLSPFLSIKMFGLFGLTLSPCHLLNPKTPPWKWNIWCCSEASGRRGCGGEQRAAYDARTSTSAWKKAVGVFVRRVAQTDRVKERLFESAVQEQQKTLPLDRVVKNECRGGIWPVAWREGGANMPKSAHDEPPPLPESNRRWRGDHKEGGKQVERGKNQMKRASVKVEPFITRKGSGKKAYHEQGHNETVWRNRKWYRIYPLFLSAAWGLARHWQSGGGSRHCCSINFTRLCFAEHTLSRLSVWFWGWDLDPPVPPLEQTVRFYWLVRSNLINMIQQFTAF